jgi:AraC-like DNA-binding protein
VQHLLRKHRVMEAFTTDDMAEALNRIWGAFDFCAPRGQKQFHAVASHWQSGPIGLSYCAYDASAEVKFPAANFVRQQVCLDGGAVTTSRGREAQMSRESASNVGFQSDIRTKFQAGYRQLVLRIDTEALNSKMEALCGSPRKVIIDPVAPVDSRVPAARTLRSLVLLLAGQLDEPDALLPDLALQELSDLLIVAFLHSGQDGATGLLDLEPRGVAPWQVRRAEQYIDGNSHLPLTVEGLAMAVGCSARSLFKTFRKSHGLSPMGFVKKRRLERAHRLLRSPEAATTVIGVALACGFQNAGHFARDFHRAFGELPSEILRRAKGERPGRLPIEG